MMKGIKSGSVIRELPIGSKERNRVLSIFRGIRYEDKSSKFYKLKEISTRRYSVGRYLDTYRLKDLKRGREYLVKVGYGQIGSKFYYVYRIKKKSR